MAVKFTEKAEKVLQIARSEARRLGHGYVGTEHILWALLHQPDSVAVQAILRCDSTVEELLGALRESLGRIPSSSGGVSSETTYTPHAKRCLELAREQAVLLDQYYIGTEHLLIGLGVLRRNCQGLLQMTFCRIVVSTISFQLRRTRQ